MEFYAFQLLIVVKSTPCIVLHNFTVGWFDDFKVKKGAKMYYGQEENGITPVITSIETKATWFQGFWLVLPDFASQRKQSAAQVGPPIAGGLMKEGLGSG